uniref:Putative glutathione S-transferase omega class member 1 n=1 Tax=Leptinotarsa decemlineata TaxID=7539 RepID=A0A1P8PEV5_LEPDE|nr:putative glutathione S-transferase omega class member 1 [Leptinotarsa decemlineata]
MKFCTCAQRTLLVLKAKEIPHEVFHISLFKKPEWYSKIHPGGEVPALLNGSNVLVQSSDICNYLEEKYHQNSLYPSEPEAKNRDKNLSEKLYRDELWLQIMRRDLHIFIAVAASSDFTTCGVPHHWQSDFEM